MVNRLPNDRANLSAAIFNNKLFIIGVIYAFEDPDNAPADWNEEKDGSYMTEVFCDDIYCLEEHPSDPALALSYTYGAYSVILTYTDSDSDSSANSSSRRPKLTLLDLTVHPMPMITSYGSLEDLAKGYDLLDSVEVYDAESDRWQQAGNMIRDKNHFSLVVVDEELYAVGGEILSVSIEKMNKITGKWELITELVEDCSGCAVAVQGSRIFLFGGSSYDTDNSFNFFEVLTGHWASESISSDELKMPVAAYFGQAVTFAC